MSVAVGIQCECELVAKQLDASGRTRREEQQFRSSFSDEVQKVGPMVERCSECPLASSDLLSAP